MVSETDPYLWSSLASLCFGLAAGQGAKSLFRGREEPAAWVRRKARRMARATTFLALSILAVAGLLVLTNAAKTGMTGDLLAWSASIVVLAILVGLRPLALGGPIVALVGAVLVLLGLGLEDWTPLGPASGPTVEIARLLPYDVGPATFHGQLALPRREFAAPLGEMSLASGSVGICAETLQLRGPLGFLARLILSPAAAALPPTAFPGNPALAAASAAAGTASSSAAGSAAVVSTATTAVCLYRVVGLVAPGGLVQTIPPPAHVSFLNAVLPLPAAAGFDLGGDATDRRALLGLAERRRSSSAAVELAALQPVSFAMALDGYALSAR